MAALLATALVSGKGLQLHFWPDLGGHRLWPGLVRQSLLVGGLLVILVRLARAQRAGRQAGLKVDKTAAASLVLIAFWTAALFTVASTSGRSVVNLVLVTALGEEVIFRGLLPAILETRRQTCLGETALSSVAFGLWHLPDAVPGSGLALIGTVVATTAAAVMVLAPLRRRTGSIYASTAVHAFVNGAALLLTKW
jgi:membrane protease YdiL (CAAX protease family)